MKGLPLPGFGRSALAAVVAGCVFACSQAPPPRLEPPPSVVVEAPRPSPPPPVVAPPPPVRIEPPPAVRVEPPPPAPPPAAPAAPPPRLVRIGLATDLASVTLPCCDGAVSARVGEEVLELVSPLTIEPAAEAVTASQFRLQVAALKDEQQARNLAARLADRLAQPADARFDAAVDLYRVRVGRWATREEAERWRGTLEARGLGEGWVVSEGGGITSPALLVRQGARRFRVPGRWFFVAASPGAGVAWQGDRYRGKLGVYLSDRGRLNLVNELPLEDYLRGVVPKEMGPLVYPELDALKAQAVAARSYTVRHLGEFADEGYDLCATPRCHVYGGMDAEQPLTDRAIAETAGEVVAWEGGVADTLYTATCGGHTEDVQAIFPTLTERPYLAAVPCLEEGLQELAGAAPRGSTLPGLLLAKLLPARPGLEPRFELETRIFQLASLAGLAAPADRLASLERREIQRFVASVFDLALDAKLFLSPADVPYLVAEPPPGWSEEALRQAAHLVASGLLTGPPEAEIGKPELDGLLFELALLVRVIERREVSFQRLGHGKLTVRSSGTLEEIELSPELVTFRRTGGGALPSTLRLVAGDALELYQRAGHLLAVAQEVDPDGVAFDRRSKRAAWTRFHTDAEIARLVEAKYPDLGFRGFEVLERGRSGRVSRIRLFGQGERSVEVVGLAVRWTLGLPETLFTVTRLKPADGKAGWLFRGRGWGHGVGLCQEGAFGMAERGHDYREILAHYYPGATVEAMHTLAPGP